jgi:hypothetical protein
MQKVGLPDQTIQSSSLLRMALDENVHPMPWTDGNTFQATMEECGVEFDWSNPSSWAWFQGDLNEYYNELIGSDSKRNPQTISSYAVHRWLGKDHSTLVHYELIHATIQQVLLGTKNDSDGKCNDHLHILDAQQPEVRGLLSSPSLSS